MRRLHCTPLGQIATYRDRPEVEEAEAHYRQALALAEAPGVCPLQSQCQLGLGKLYAMIGHRAGDRAALSAAIEPHRAVAMTFRLPQAETALAQVKGQ